MKRKQELGKADGSRSGQQLREKAKQWQQDFDNVEDDSDLSGVELNDADWAQSDDSLDEKVKYSKADRLVNPKRGAPCRDCAFVLLGGRLFSP